MSAPIKTNDAKHFFIDKLSYIKFYKKILSIESTSSIKLIDLEQKEYINPNWIIGIIDA